MSVESTGDAHCLSNISHLELRPLYSVQICQPGSHDYDTLTIVSARKPRDAENVILSERKLVWQLLADLRRQMQSVSFTDVDDSGNNQAQTCSFPMSDFLSRETGISQGNPGRTISWPICLRIQTHLLSIRMSWEHNSSKVKLRRCRRTLNFSKKLIWASHHGLNSTIVVRSKPHDNNGTVMCRDKAW